MIEELREAASPLRLSSKFTALNGAICFSFGMLFIVWPGAVRAILGEGEFAGREATLVRALGMSGAVIGWLYLFGGRTEGRQFVAASVFGALVFGWLAVGMFC